MRIPNTKRKPNPARPKAPPSRFAPAAFLSGSPEVVRLLCQDLATQAAKRFADLTGSSWKAVGASLVNQLRTIGHDLSNVEDAEGLQEWEATWYHPKGTFKLVLSFRAPNSVEVTWKADDASFTASA